MLPLTPSLRHPCPRSAARGFTLVELMVMITILAVTVGVMIMVTLAASRNKVATSNRLDANQGARVALDLITNDLRSAGYGADLDYSVAPQPPFAYVDSLQVLICANLAPYPDTTSTVFGSPQAYAPTGNPKPFPVDGTAWQPPIRYRTGAEIVRWTLDVNDDGVVNSDDVNSSPGLDARRTRNPDDYVLMREVWGDSTGLVSGNNGGVQDRIALIRAPGGTVPPLFRVYMKGSTMPYDWSLGPVPTTQLANIARIQVNLVAPSPKPDWRGQYAETRLSTDIKSFRSVPDFGAPLYAVTGMVFDDLNGSGTKQAGEPGLAGAQVRLGKYAGYTAATGAFTIAAPAGTYTLRHRPPAGYGVLTSPDSFVVTVPPATSRDFADTSMAGGWVSVLVFADTDGDAVHDFGEPGVQSVRVDGSPYAQTAYTDSAGLASLFAAEGTYAVTVTPPDSFVVTSSNPQGGSMPDGGSASHAFGLKQSDVGTVSGRVYRDNNINGVRDGSEPGIENVWVGVTPNAGTTVLGFDLTDANGDYSITVPVNVPPSTTPYQVYTILPKGYYPTSAWALGPLWLASGDVLTGKDFGMNAFQVITLNASRLLSLSNGDLIEQDWSGGLTQWDTKGHKDSDLILGADAGGADNISVWFNKYDSSPSFDTNPTYARLAPQSVLSMALDRIDTNTPSERPDLVTGTKMSAAGNFFVWYCQNSSGNLGYFPTAFSPGQGYTTQDVGDVQSVLTFDCAGGAGPDILVGTKSTVAGEGHLEVWQNDDAATPSFTRQEIYPPNGSIPGGTMGEVVAMALADFDLDGVKDLVVGTRTGSYSGELIFFRLTTRGNNNRFVHKATVPLPLDAVMGLTVLDMDGDGDLDVVAGTQHGWDLGHVQFHRNDDPSLFLFTLARQVDAEGVVTSVASADFGGISRPDIAVGFRDDQTSYQGGVRIYFTDLGTLPATGMDPSDGLILYEFVAAITVGNFNYGVQPSLPTPPYLTDLACGVKISATTGAVVIFIR